MPAFNNKDPEVNTGCRGMFAREYHQWTDERMVAEADKQKARESGTIMPATTAPLAPAAPAVPAPAEEPVVAAAEEPAAELPTPLMNVYPRKAGEGMRTAHDTVVPCYTYPQLERMSAGGPRVGIKLAAATLRDRIGELGLTDLGLPPLNIYGHKELIIEWVLKAQVALAQATGLDVTMDSFGVPRDDGRSGLNHSQRSAV